MLTHLIHCLRKTVHRLRNLLQLQMHLADIRQDLRPDELHIGGVADPIDQIKSHMEHFDCKLIVLLYLKQIKLVN